MRVQAITYQGRLVAACTRRQFLLTGEIEHLPRTDAVRTFVVLMCTYACQALRSDVPYRDDDARRFARGCLIPAELLERPVLDIERAAYGLRVPAHELRAARAAQGLLNRTPRRPHPS
jgi:hypothetical protein